MVVVSEPWNSRLVSSLHVVVVSDSWNNNLVSSLLVVFVCGSWNSGLVSSLHVINVSESCNSDFVSRVLVVVVSASWDSSLKCQACPLLVAHCLWGYCIVDCPTLSRSVCRVITSYLHHHGVALFDWFRL